MTNSKESPRSSETAKAKLERVISQYASEVATLGVLNEVVFGFRPGEPVHVVNILHEDFSIEFLLTPQYEKLRELNEGLHNREKGIGHVVLTYLNPSGVYSLLDAWNERGMEIARLPMDSE